jgi:hypothetical protein
MAATSKLFDVASRETRLVSRCLPRPASAILLGLYTSQGSRRGAQSTFGQSKIGIGAPKKIGVTFNKEN